MVSISWRMMFVEWSLFSDLFVQSSYYSSCCSSEYSSHLVFSHPSIHLISSAYSFVFVQWLLLGIAISFGLQSLPVTLFSVSLTVFCSNDWSHSFLFFFSLNLSFLVSVAFSPFLLSVIINTTFVHSCSYVWSHHFLGSTHSHLFHLRYFY